MVHVLASELRILTKHLGAGRFPSKIALNRALRALKEYNDFESRTIDEIKTYNSHLFKPETHNITLKELKDLVTYSEKYGYNEFGTIRLWVYEGNLGATFHVTDTNGNNAEAIYNIDAL